MRNVCNQYGRFLKPDAFTMLQVQEISQRNKETNDFQNEF